MFEELTRRLEGVFSTLKGRGKLSEKDVKAGLRDVRRALLEADVNFKVARDFIAEVEKKAIGQEVLGSVRPGHQVVKIVHDELVALLGGQAESLKRSSSVPTIVFVVGLQGSGKTTFCAKLARQLKSKGGGVMLAAGDVYRPAAQKQLEVLGGEVGAPVHMGGGADPVGIYLGALKEAESEGLAWLLVDTAGRLHIDEEMMEELRRMKAANAPHEVLLVVDGMTGQDAVNLAKAFNEALDIDGVVLTKLDGDARGGAALSVRAVTGVPIKFVGVGEHTDALEVFHPDRMASRILGMGDIVTLVEKAGQAVDEEKALKLEEKLRKDQFTLDDFREQLGAIKNMGPLQDLVKMIPGAGKAFKGPVELDDGALGRVEAIINSMTPEERRDPSIIDGSRRKRISRGSGTKVQEVNRLLKQFADMQKMFRSMKKGKRRGMMRFPGF
jgi:signal recognition particle subunit SRP54